MSCTTRCYWKICSWNIDYLHLHRIPHQLRTMGLSFLLIFEASNFPVAQDDKVEGPRSDQCLWFDWSYAGRISKGWWCLPAGWSFEMSKTWIREEIWSCWSEDFLQILGLGLLQTYTLEVEDQTKNGYFCIIDAKLTKSYYHGAKYRRWTSRHIYWQDGDWYTYLIW